MPRDDVRAALVARERQVAELRAQLADHRARTELAEAAAALHIGEAAAQAGHADSARAEALEQRARAEAREDELTNVRAAWERDRRALEEVEASRAYRLAAALRRLRRPRLPS